MAAVFIVSLFISFDPMYSKCGGLKAHARFHRRIRSLTCHVYTF